MSLSLNELEVVVHKAALGAGLPVGFAEDAARLAGWLARAGLEPAAPVQRDLGELLAGRAGRCALRQLPPLLDGLVVAPDGETRTLELAEPLLAAAALATAANDVGLSGQAAWRLPEGGGVEVFASPDLVELRCDRPAALQRPGAARVTLRKIARGGAGLPLVFDTAGFLARRQEVVERGLAVEPEAWAALRQLAARILVPASDRSRLAGAGAGDIDRDS